MSILAKCPTCKRLNRAKSKTCRCGEDLDKAKRNKKVKYFIDYGLPGGKAKREYVGFSIEEAKTREREVLELKQKNPTALTIDRRMTFDQLAEWYLGLKPLQGLAYYQTLTIYLKKFLSEFGSRYVTSLKPADLENLQAKRKEQGYADGSIDQEIAAARSMVNKAFHNDLVDVAVTNVFRKVKKVLKRNGNVRDRILSPEEFRNLIANAPRHTGAIIATGYYTGMREGEILSLTWDKVDLKDRMIRLEASDTKDREKREIPICNDLLHVLKSLPRALHDQHVFLYKGKPISDLRSGLKIACKGAGIAYGRFTKNGFVFHDLRHTFNTNMRKAGVPESVIMAVTGHSTREMFDRYNTVDSTDKAQAIDRFSSYLGNLDQILDQQTS